MLFIRKKDKDDWLEMNQIGKFRQKRESKLKKFFKIFKFKTRPDRRQRELGDNMKFQLERNS